MPTSLNYEMQAQITPYEYIGDDPNFGSLQLTKLARAFEYLYPSNLDFLFPAEMSYERTLIVEQLIEGHGIMPPVQPGRLPQGQHLESDRLRRFSVTPQTFREDDHVEMMYINQLRKPGTINEKLPAQEWIKRRVERLTGRHRRAKEVFQARMLLGGWQYYDPRTNVSIDVSSNIPAHNFFSYNGWNASVGANVAINIGGRNYNTLGAVTAAKGRTEASFFTSTDGYIAVPWTYPQADIIRGLRLLQNYLYLTNKNKFTHIILNSQLMSVITTVNEYLKAFQGIPGMLVNNLPTNTVAGNAVAAVASNGVLNNIVFGPGGKITSIAGLEVIELDGIWRNPSNNNQLEVYWPAHKVALVAAQSMMDANAKLGATYHCSAEAPDGQPGIWMQSSANLPLPQLPGFFVRMGDAFIPYPVYPHWICLIDVCEPTTLYSNIPLLPDLGYGTF